MRDDGGAVAGRHPEDVEPLESELTDDAEAPEEDASDETEDDERSQRVIDYWAALGIDPVEIALPRGGVGLTLREYRVVEEPELDDEELEDEDADADADDDADDEQTADTVRAETDDDADDEDEDARPTRGSAAEDEDEDEADEDDKRPTRDRRAPAVSDADLAARFNREYEDDEEDEDEEDEDEDLDDVDPGRARVAAGEEEAVFLATDGTLHLFRDAESLVAFVKSPAVHDLTASAHWAELVETLTPDLLVPDDEDRYELDLVVENLRGGRDVWERDLIVGAGELARDLAYALDLVEVQANLAAGAPLDDLDEAIRAKGFFGRRKLKRIGAEQAALAWRSVIGRISSSVEWHG